jgi:hypothetical protein
MQIGSTKYSIGTSSLNRKTPGTLKFVMDILLFLSLAIGLLPELPDDIGKWVIAAGGILKLLSNFISEHMPQKVEEEVIDSEN